MWPKIKEIGNQRILLRVIFVLTAIMAVIYAVPYFDQAQNTDYLWIFAVLSVFASVISVKSINAALTLNSSVIIAGIVLHGTWISIWSALVEVLLIAFLYRSKLLNAIINAGQMMLTIMLTGLLQALFTKMNLPWMLSDLALALFYLFSNTAICATAIYSLYPKNKWKKIFLSMVHGNTSTYYLILLIGIIGARNVLSYGWLALIPVMVCFFIISRVFQQYYFTLKDSEKKLEQIKELNISMITTVANSIEARDPYTSGHSWRVAEYGKEIAASMKLSQKSIDEVYLGGILHDIGKIGIEDSILSKPSKLTDEEFEKVKLHPVIGYEIIKEAGVFPELLPAIRWHHERIDGKGYPDGLKGDDIPLMARILAVSDAFDAMVSDRPYRKGLSIEEALNRIKEGSGTQFDTEIADVFIGLMKEKDISKIQSQPSRDFANAFKQSAAAQQPSEN